MTFPRIAPTFSTVRLNGYFPWNHGKFICKGKENGHVQAYAPTGAMVLKWRSSLTSKLDGYPITSDPHLWRQACPWRKSLSRKIALTRIKFYGRKLQVKAFPAFGQMQGCADFMRLWRNFMPRQFSSMIFYYHLFIGEVRTIRNETTYPIHGNIHWT